MAIRSWEYIASLVDDIAGVNVLEYYRHASPDLVNRVVEILEQKMGRRMVILPADA